MGGDIRSADPDHLEVLADLLHTRADDGIYGRLASIFDRARALNVSDQVTVLQPLLTWLMDTSGQLRDGAAILRGDSPSMADVSVSDLMAGLHHNNGTWELEMFGRANINEIVALASQDDLSEDELERMASLLGGLASNPDFAGELIDQIGMADFLRLTEEIADEEGTERLRGLLGTVLTSAFYVPGTMDPRSAEYQDWAENTPQGRRYEDRLTALRQVGRGRLERGEDDEGYGWDVVLDLMEWSETPMDTQFYVQVMDNLSQAEGLGRPWAEGLPDRLTLVGARTNTAAVEEALHFPDAAARMEWLTDLTERGVDLTDAELAQLSAVLANNGSDEAFAVDLASRLGADGVLELWTDLSVPSSYGDASDVRTDFLNRLQEGLGITLGRATRSGDPRMEQWESDMIAAGEQNFDGQHADPIGYQVMSSLMYHGEYGEDFLLAYGYALMASEDGRGALMWPQVTPLLEANYGGEGSPWIDPAGGYMTALARTPEVATGFFRQEQPVDVLSYFLTGRYAGHAGDFAEQTGAMAAAGNALMAATTGVDPFDPTAPQPTAHTPEREAVFQRSLDMLAATGDDFPPAFRVPMANALSSHGTSVIESVSGNPLLDRANLYEVAMQVSLDPEAYDHLNEGMNHALVAFIENEPDQVRAIQATGHTVGFLEQARRDVLYGEGSSEQAAAERNAFRFRHVVEWTAKAVIPSSAVGDGTARLVEFAARGWAQDQSNATADRVADEDVALSDLRDSQLRALSEIWMDVNGEWAAQSEGYRSPENVLGEMGSYANLGRDTAAPGGPGI